MTQTAHEKIPMSEAIKVLTLGEIGIVETHYRSDFNELSPMKMMTSLIFALERRRTQGFKWTDLDSWTVQEAEDYFAPEPNTEDSESGKDSNA
jgi:hypothetical protein